MIYPIKKSIKEIKEDIGVYYSLNKDFDSRDYNNTPPFSTNDFIKIWINNYDKNFKDRVNFLYAVFSAEYKKKGLFLEIKEHFCSYYVFASTRHNSRTDIFFTINDVKKYIKKQLLFELDLFIHNKNVNETESFMVEAIKKNTFAKKIMLKTDLGRKIDYLIKHRDMLTTLSFDSFMNIKMVYEYDKENDLIYVPENWDLIRDKKNLMLHFVSFDEISESKAKLYSAFYDKKANAMNLTFETETRMAYNYQQLDFDVDYNKYVFSNPGVYLTKEEARKEMLDIITGYEEKIAKIKAQLS